MRQVLVAIIMLWPASSCFGIDYIRLAAMNIEHLGGRTPGQRPIAIAEHIFLASPDILVLEEIYDNDEENDTRTNEELTTVFELLRQNELHDWDYVLLPNKAINDKSQLCAVAWNRKRVSIVGEPMRLNVSVNDDPHNCWDRHPHAIKFSRGENKTDLVVVPLHMKANPGVGQDNSAEIEQREHEAQLLVSQLDEIVAEFMDNDIVLLGDTNALRTAEDCIQEFVAAGYEDLNERDSARISRERLSTASLFLAIVMRKSSCTLAST
jgi:predicted extracellular nuclease